MAGAGRIGETVDAVEQGFDGYVRERADGLLRLAWLVTRNWEDARDAVQDAFASLYPRWDRLPPGGRREAYITRTVVNACLAVVRARRSQPVADPARLPEAVPIGDHAGPIAAAETAWRLCTELPPTQRAAVVLRFYRDYSFGDIAQVLGCTESTARSHVHRALAALRLRVNGGDDDG